MWGLIKAHSLTGKLSRKHAFLDMTWGHADEMTELHSVNKYTLMCCIHMLEAWGACRILETRFGCSLRYLTGVIHPATKMIFQKEPADTRGWKCSSRQDRGHICIPTWGDVHENDCFFYNFGIIFAGIWTHSGLFGFRSLSCPAFKARLPSCYCLSLFTRLSGNFYNSCAETQLKTREQHQEKTFKRPGWSAYWNSSRETALFPLSSCKLRSPFRVQWRSRSHSFSLSSCFSGHTEAWAGRQRSLKTPRITELMHRRHVHFRPHTCDHLSPARWSPGHLSSVSTPAGPAGYSVVPSLVGLQFFPTEEGKYRHRLIITVTNLNFSNSTAMTAAMWGSTSS